MTRKVLEVVLSDPPVGAQLEAKSCASFRRVPDAWQDLAETRA